jgi:putative peptidoglycan lipid II flippase
LDNAPRRHHPPTRSQAVKPRADWGQKAPTAGERLMGIVRTALPTGALILVVVTAVYILLGVLKAKIIGHMFGQGPETDAFNAAFTVPALALELLLMGGLIACFVPVYVALRDEEPEQARAFARTVLTLAILVMTLTVGLLFVFAPQAVDFAAPGFNAEQRDLGINLFRMLCVTQVIFAASWVLGEVLIAEQRWIWYGIAPATYLAGIIIGTLALGEQIGIYAAALGAIGGASAHLAIRLIGIFRTPFRPWPSLNLRVKGLGQYVWLSLPKMVSQPMDMATIFYFTRLASTLEPGSVTRIENAQNFSAPLVLLIGTQFALAAFPSLSQAADEGDRRRFRKIFGTNLATIAVLSTGAALCALFLGNFAISIVLGGGAFTPTDVSSTAMVLAVFSVAIPLEATTELLARSIYATRNTLLPTVAQIAGFVVILVAAQLLLPAAGILAIPASYGLGMLTKLIVLALALRVRMDTIGRPAEAQAWAPAWAATGGQAYAARGASSGAGAYSGATEPDREPWAAPGRRGAMAGRPPRRRRPIARQAAGVLAVVLVLFAGLSAAVWASQGAYFGFTPNTTPWARVRPTEALDTASPTITTNVPTATPSAAPSASVSLLPALPTPTPTPVGQFAMDLYHDGDYVGELTNKWCIPAAMQTMMNIMDQGADGTEATQSRLYDLGVSIARSRQGTPEPESWAQGLQQLGYGHYEVSVASTRDAAVKLVVKQIRATKRPAGLLVWYGWHAWVVSGFVATADPAKTDDFVVTALYIEDVWYPRQSKLWNKDRDGYSRPPDSEVPTNILYQDFKAWDQAVNYPEYQKKFVVIIPVK